MKLKHFSISGEAILKSTIFIFHPYLRSKKWKIISKLNFLNTYYFIKCYLNRINYSIDIICYYPLLQQQEQFKIIAIIICREKRQIHNDLIIKISLLCLWYQRPKWIWGYGFAHGCQAWGDEVYPVVAWLRGLREYLK